MQSLQEILFALCEPVFVSGGKNGVLPVLQDLLSAYPQRVDALGNLLVTFYPAKEGQTHILLDAHMDEVGFTVCEINDRGFVRLAPCGGIDRRILPAQQLTIFGRKPIPAVVAALPPHLSKGEKDLPAVEDMWVDTGLFEKAKEVVSLGDMAAVSVSPCTLKGDLVTSRALDNRASCAALVYLCQLLSGDTLPFGLTLQFSTQEEVGLRGAKTAGFSVDPTHAVVVDVTFGFSPGENPRETGKLKGGPMIGFAPVLNRALGQALCQVAQREKIPYAREVMGRSTGTNADVLSVSREGVKTVTLSIPIRNMHTPVEVAALSDIENTARLLAAAVSSKEVWA